jgi:GNAT superfamily N-acetyltransferase
MNDLDPHQVYVGYSITTPDVPGESTFDAIGYDVWLRDVWKSPAFASGLSVAAVAGDEVAALTMASVDVNRLWTDMTGTVPAHRGRGLAKLVKAETLRRSAEAGVTAAFTANDELNQPMLTVNAWLGYRRVATHTGLLRTL